MSGGKPPDDLYPFLVARYWEHGNDTHSRSAEYFFNRLGIYTEPSFRGKWDPAMLKNLKNETCWQYFTQYTRERFSMPTIPEPRPRMSFEDIEKQAQCENARMFGRK